MELWIISQDRECLMKVDRLDYDVSNYKHRIVANGYQTLVAEYETKKRALEVLDEIQDKIRVKFLLKQKTILKPETVKSAKEYFENLNNINLIAGDGNFDIVPINYNDAVIYEMPKK